MGSTALSQGCVPARYISLSLGAEGVSYLHPGQWEADVSYRFLHAETVFEGSEEQPRLHAVGGRNTVHSIDLAATYALDSRFSLSLTLPFEHDDFSLINDDGLRHSGSSGGLGDLRLVRTPGYSIHPLTKTGINLGLGVKFPTGDDRATDYFHTADGQVILRPVDIAAQLGDGGWGIVAQMQAFQKLARTFMDMCPASIYSTRKTSTEPKDRRQHHPW
jgi:hypothetical protein